MTSPTSSIRMTPLRTEILALIAQAKHPITAYELLRQLRTSRANSEPPTVYRVLDYLQDNRLIHKIANNNTYVACDKPHKPHLGQIFLCKKCGHSFETHDTNVINIIEEYAKKNHFHLSQDLIEITGLCHNCLNRE